MCVYVCVCLFVCVFTYRKYMVDGRPYACVVCIMFCVSVIFGVLGYNKFPGQGEGGSR